MCSALFTQGKTRAPSRAGCRQSPLASRLLREAGSAGDAGASPPALADECGEVGMPNAVAGLRRLSSAKRDEPRRALERAARLRFRPGCVMRERCLAPARGPGSNCFGNRPAGTDRKPVGFGLRSVALAEGGCLLRRVGSAAARTTSRLPAGSRRMLEAVSATEPEGRRAASLRRPEGMGALGEGDWRLRSYSAVAPKDKEGRLERGSRPEPVDREIGRPQG